MAQRLWKYNVTADSPVTLQAVATDTAIVLLKVSCWSSAGDGVFVWSGSSGAGYELLKAQIGEDGSSGADDLHLRVPAGQSLLLTMSGTGGCTSWWYVIKELMGAGFRQVAAAPSG